MGFQKSAKRKKNLKTKFYRSLFFLPALIFMAIFLLYPVLNTLWISFVSEDNHFVFLQEYQKVLSSNDVINQKDLLKDSLGEPFPQFFMDIYPSPFNYLSWPPLFAVLFKDLKYNFIF